jgi:hypothetical protein
MSVDLLRQLDAYGDHVESLIDPVTAGEVRNRPRSHAARKGKPAWLQPAMVAGAAFALVVAVVGLASLSSIVDHGAVDSNFSEIGGTIDGDDDGGRQRRAPATTSAPATTAALGDADRALEAAAPESGELPASAVDPEPVLLAGGQPTTTTPPPTTAAPAQPDETPATTVPPPADAQAGRAIVFTADLQVAVGDAEAAGASATLIIESVGGFLSGERTTGGADAVTIMTFKVPPSLFNDAVTRLSELGVVTDRTVVATDVTERVIDLESQITTAAISVERLQTFLAEADTVNDVAKLERELTNREQELEQLRGELTTLQNRIALATIQVQFSEAIPKPNIRLAISGYPSISDDGAACPGQTPISVDEGEDATVCVVISNNGKTQLTDLELAGPALELFPGGLNAVEGDLGAVLEPGDAIILSADIEVAERTRTDLVVSGTPVNQTGETVAERTVTATKRLAIDVVEPDDLPGFTDAWEAGVNALATVGSLALLVVGAILPWLWIPAIILAVMWWRRRR